MKVTIVCKMVSIQRSRHVVCGTWDVSSNSNNWRMGILMVSNSGFSTKPTESLAAVELVHWIMINIVNIVAGFLLDYLHYNRIQYKCTRKLVFFHSFCCRCRASRNFEMYNLVFHLKHCYVMALVKTQRSAHTWSL